MATSGSVDFTQTRDQIIKNAYKLLGVYGVGRTISDDDLQTGADFLNLLIKSWQTRGLHLWAKNEASLFLAVGQNKYVLSSSASADNVSDNVVLTTLSAAYAASTTNISVASTTGMTAGDKIGVVLADNTVFWTTINTVSSSTALILTSGLSGAANSGGVVYDYTTRVNRPLRILSCRRSYQQGVNKQDIPMVSLSHEEYFDLVNKNTLGPPTSYHFDPTASQGTLYVWPTPNNGNYYITFTYERMLEDVDAGSDNVDFPTEWLEALTWQLAVRLAPIFGKEKKLSVLIPVAGEMFQRLLDWDQEQTSISLSPDME